MEGERSKIIAKRAYILGGGFFLFMIVLACRMYYLQVIQADKYQTLADENRIGMQLLAPPRGIIFDRYGVPLAENHQNFRVMLVPERLQTNIDIVLRTLGTIIPLSPRDKRNIKKKIKQNSRGFIPVTIRENLSFEDMAKIQLNIPDLPGIVIDEGLTRHYPHGTFAAHLLGYVSSVSDADLEANKKDYDPLLEVPGFKLGKTGIEKYYDKELRGTSGSKKIEVNAYGRVIKEIEQNPGAPGKDIYLTIDYEIQKVAEEALAGNSGAAVVIDIRTGEVLTLASVPAYNPNSFNVGLSSDEWAALSQDPFRPLNNKVTDGLYSPGSTFKMIVAMAGLENNVITPRDTFYCGGYIIYGNNKFHCWKKEGHGTVDMLRGIQVSCDVYFYELSKILGIDKIADMAKKFGLGNLTNIDLPKEKEGLVPTRAWKQARFNQRWQNGETIITGIGQGYLLTTPLQLAVMSARLASGKKILPYLLKKDNTPEFEDIGVSPVNLQIIKNGMFKVVNEPGGTAFSHRFNYNGLQMAGKTGTTQVRRITIEERLTGIRKESELPWELRNHALFVAFAPFDEPRYAVSVIVEHGGSGSGVAAPIAAKILKKALELEDIRKNKE